MTKRTKSLSLRSRKEAEELFSGTSIFIDDTAETRKLGHCMATNLSLFDCKANGEDNRLGLAEREEKDRRVGVVRGTVMAAAIAIEGVGQLLQSQVTLKKYTRVYEVIYIYIYT